MSASFCFKVCNRTPNSSIVTIKVWPPSDQPPVALEGHLDCFEGHRDPAVSPDSSREFGRIPAGARCLFCGRRLPIVGVHAYAVGVETETKVHRFWAHAGWLKKTISFALLDK